MTTSTATFHGPKSAPHAGPLVEAIANEKRYRDIQAASEPRVAADGAVNLLGAGEPASGERGTA